MSNALSGFGGGYTALTGGDIGGGRVKKYRRLITDPLNLFGGSNPPAPAPEPVVPLPDPQAISTQRKRALARRAGTGRASTIFTEASSAPLGGA